MFKKHGVYLSIITILILVIVIMSVNDLKDKFTLSPNNDNLIRTKATRGDITLSIGGSGKVFANSRRVIKSQVDNIIDKVWVKEGQVVNKGDIILTYKKEKIESEIKMTKLNLKLARNELQKLRNQEKNLRVYSPISGVVDNIYINSGELLEKGHLLGMITDKSVMELRASFYKSQFDTIKTGQQAEVFLPGYFVTLNGKVIRKIDRGRPQPDGGIVYDVIIEVSNPGGLSPGTSTQVTIKNDKSGFLAAQSGKLEFKESSNIYSYMNGIVKNIYVSTQEQIKKGQLVLELSNDDLKSKINAQEIKINQIELKLNDLKASLDDSVLYSPMDGTIQNLYVSDDEELIFNKSIASIINLKDLETVISVDEEELSKIDIGQKVIITSKEIPNKDFEGKISKIALEGRYINDEVKYDVTIKINHDTNLKPTMAIDVEIISKFKDDVLLLPLDAVDHHSGIYYVTLENNESDGNELKTIPIEVGLISEEYIEVISGLKEGDIVLYSKDN